MKCVCNWKFNCKVASESEGADLSGIEMSDQNSSILRGPAHVLYHEEDRNVGEPVVQMAEHDFMFSEATGSSGLSMGGPNLLVDLGKSNERKRSESEDSEDEMRSISLVGCSYDLPNDHAIIYKLESHIKRSLFAKASMALPAL
jgi:hypothetical protein